ncbi:hypothetical protein KSC_081180 [Ktedonobacter sp. SOSP1-52]|uniref:serine/threonine protein kinase n=1 Tax=Ktedonobacter sp. SOSP1-52 TaxID=2778366 RepID=UPI001915C1AF|nr:serine/threonine-protein kinase [Ktedonobacter sp. SOSP1-52]GHO69226.1 hypothetical protein KSC_081180 [Ktedonobacter sp. SOSP1-52]
MKEQRGNLRNLPGATDGQANPQKFGNYDLVHRIDVGGMGEVYLARQRSAFGREVAVKIIRSDLAYDSVARKRFLREAEVSAHLKHEHILPLFEFGEEQGRLFLVTPYIKGGTLAQRLQQGPLSYGEIYQLFKALVQAIAYIHKRGVIHRDLKPSNILLDREDDGNQVYVRLIDFGIASLQGSLASPPLTTADHEVGTVAYMAPERADGVAAPSNDIYSLGIILYQMITGHLPHISTGTMLPPPLEEVVARSVAPDPARRYASADELLQAFEQAYRSLRVSPETRPSGLSDKFPAVSPTPKSAGPSNLPPTPTRQGRDLASKTASGTPSGAYPAIPASPRSYQVASAEGMQVRGKSSPDLGQGLPGKKSPIPPRKEQAVLQREEFILPGSTKSFGGGDYDAPTSFVDPAQLRQSSPQTSRPPAPRPQKNRRPLALLIPIGIVAIVVLIVGMSLFVFQNAITAKVTFSPQVQTISKVYTIRAVDGTSHVDTNAGTIPINEARKTETGTRSGPATGRPFFCLFNCPTVVASNDIINLGIETKQGLIKQLTQDLNNEVKGKNASPLGQPSFNDKQSSYQPEVGQKSSTVSVTLTEEGILSYYSNSDAQAVARQKLLQDAGANFEVMNSTVRVGQPVLKGTDAQGATLLVPIAGVLLYQITPQKLQAMQNHLKSMKKSDARAYIAKQEGIDPNSVSVNLSYGDTLPGNVQQIAVSSQNPATLPSVQLPAVPTPQNTPTTDNSDNNDDNNSMGSPAFPPYDPRYMGQ